MSDVGIEIKHDDRGKLCILIGGQALPMDYIRGEPNADGERLTLPAFAGYEVRHDPVDGVFEVDVTLRAPRAECRLGVPGESLSVRGIEFPAATGYAVRDAFEPIVEVTITLVTDYFSANLGISGGRGPSVPGIPHRILG